MSKQTAVNQIFAQIKAARKDTKFWSDSMLVDWLLEQEERYKQMEKEQMKDVYLTHCVKAERLRKIFEQQFDDYYNETYGGNNE